MPWSITLAPSLVRILRANVHSASRADLPDPPSLPDPRDIVNPAIDLLPDYLIAEIFGFHLSAELIATCALYPDKCSVAAGLSLVCTITEF